MKKELIIIRILFIIIILLLLSISITLYKYKDILKIIFLEIIYNILY